MDTKILTERYSKKFRVQNSETASRISKILEFAINEFPKDEFSMTMKIDKFIQDHRDLLSEINKKISLLEHENLIIISDFEDELVKSNLDTKYKGISYFLYFVFEFIAFEKTEKIVAEDNIHHPVLNIKAFDYKRNNDSRHKRELGFSFYGYDNHLY